MTIKKITKVIASPSEEKVINSWKQIRALKVKLLQESDWVFVIDSNLTQACISAWIKWREKVRKSKEIDNLIDAEEYLKALSNNRPELHYTSEKPKTLESYKKLLIKALNDAIKEKIELISDEYGSRDLLMEKFEEAVRYKQGSTKYILLEIEAELSGKTIDEVADSAITNRQTYLEKLIKLERSRHLYTNHIQDVETYEECDKLLESIFKMVERHGH